MAIPIIRSDAWMKRVAEALGIEPSETRRVIIDAEEGSLVMIYVEKYGTSRMLDIELPDVSRAEVVILDKEGS